MKTSPVVRRINILKTKDLAINPPSRADAERHSMLGAVPRLKVAEEGLTSLWQIMDGYRYCLKNRYKPS